MSYKRLEKWTTQEIGNFYNPLQVLKHVLLKAQRLSDQSQANWADSVGGYFPWLPAFSKLYNAFSTLSIVWIWKPAPIHLDSQCRPKINSIIWATSPVAQLQNTCLPTLCVGLIAFFSWASLVLSSIHVYWYQYPGLIFCWCRHQYPSYWPQYCGLTLWYFTCWRYLLLLSV